MKKCKAHADISKIVFREVAINEKKISKLIGVQVPKRHAETERWYVVFFDWHSMANLLDKKPSVKSLETVKLKLDLKCRLNAIPSLLRNFRQLAEEREYLHGLVGHNYRAVLASHNRQFGTGVEDGRLKKLQDCGLDFWEAATHFSASEVFRLKKNMKTIREGLADWVEVESVIDIFTHAYGFLPPGEQFPRGYYASRNSVTDILYESINKMVKIGILEQRDGPLDMEMRWNPNYSTDWQ